MYTVTCSWGGTLTTVDQFRSWVDAVTYADMQNRIYRVTCYHVVPA